MGVRGVWRQRPGAGQEARTSAATSQTDGDHSQENGYYLLCHEGVSLGPGKSKERIGDQGRGKARLTLDGSNKPRRIGAEQEVRLGAEQPGTGDRARTPDMAPQLPDDPS